MSVLLQEYKGLSSLCNWNFYNEFQILGFSPQTSSVKYKFMLIPQQIVWPVCTCVLISNMLP